MKILVGREEIIPMDWEDGKRLYGLGGREETIWIGRKGRE